MRALLGLGLLSVLGVSAAGQGAELEVIKWHTNVIEAWREAQTRQRPLLVYVTHDNCAYCAKMKQGTWTDARIARAIRQGYVPLALNGSQPSDLVKELGVAAYPTTFVISPQAIVLERINGYVTPDALATRLASVPNPAAAKIARSQ